MVVDSLFIVFVVVLVSFSDVELVALADDEKTVIVVDVSFDDVVLLSLLAEVVSLEVEEFVVSEG